MKKLLILLCLTLGFSQTKLETREFIQEVNLNNGMVDIRELTNTNLTHYSVQILPPINFTGGSTCTFMVHYGSSHLVYNLGYTHISTTNGTLTENIHINSELDSQIWFSMYANTVCDVTPLKFWVTAEFPEEDTGYIEEGFEFCVEEGVNLTSFPCENDVALTTTFPQEALNNISSIVGQGEATINNNGQFFGSLNKLKASKGYWIISNSSFCYNYTCAEN
tara:strand:+ start:4205 stop:4867 length:663 start_codon:yes stop_codon:yes gene_type:complete